MEYEIKPLTPEEAELIGEKLSGCVVLTYACDWNANFFKKHGYAVRGVPEDHPKGHRSYELQKLL